MSPNQLMEFLAYDADDEIRDALGAPLIYVERRVAIVPGHCMRPPRDVTGSDVEDAWLLYRTTDLGTLAAPPWADWY